jgi:dolichol-phosphate mannosyltransferase
MGKLSIIIPVYYGADTLMDCYLDFKEKVCAELSEYELILVDDGSGDNSYEIMEQIAARDSHVRLLKLSRNFGSYAAVFAGLCECTGDCATIKAADLQEPSELILQMYESWRQGNKVVLAAREDREDRSLFSALYYMLVRRFVSKLMPKGGFDCYLIDRNVIEVLKLLDEPNSALTLQILWSGFKTAVVPYVRLARKAGKSRWTLAKKIKLVVDSFVGFSFAPVRMLTIIGALFFTASIIYGLYLAIGRMTNHIHVEGWTTMMIIVLLSSGLIMLSLGILGEYVWRILDAARGRPVYIIDRQDDKASDKNQPSA